MDQEKTEHIVIKNTRSNLEKILLIVVGILILCNAYNIWQKNRAENLLIKGMESVSKEIEGVNLRLDSLAIGQQKKTINVKKRSAAVDDKLKKDEAIIDNRIITDDELDEFLAKHAEN